MKRLLASIAISIVPVVAQTAGPATTPAAPATSQSSATPAASATSPVPAAEPTVTGYVDLGWRWVTGIDGSTDAYRAIVDLPSGPKFLGGDLTWKDPSQHYFDQIHINATTWGSDPYETVHVDAEKSKIYNFTADYRDFAYYNFLPSYADPLMSRGIVLDEQSYELRKHIGSVSLELFPTNWIVPYFAFDHDSEAGAGVTTLASDVNPYPVPENLSNTLNLYRGGVRIQKRRFHITLEEGGTTFRDNETLYQSPGNSSSGLMNSGNVFTPYFGQTLDLTSLIAGYGITGSSTYSKGDFTATPTDWLDLFGQYIFSQPHTDVDYQQANTGSFVLQNQLLFYTGQEYLLAAAAKMPHSTASAGFELHPWHRVRIREEWLTDRLHNAGNASSTNQLFGAQGETIAALLASTLATNYNQAETNVFFDASSKLMLRAGYRYVWGDAGDLFIPPAYLSSEEGTLRRNVGIIGFRYRPTAKLTLNGEAEGAASNGAYFRTSLYNYERARAQVRYQATNSISVVGDFTLLKNQNPTAGVNYDFSSVQESVSLFWSPKAGKFGDFEASYSRSDLRSDIGYLEPETLSADLSLYRDNAHIGSGLFNFKLPRKIKLTTGGSFFISSGSRPTGYYQPMATLWIPVQKHATFFTEWTYYDYGEAFYLYEGFRTHVVVAGVRLMR